MKKQQLYLIILGLFLLYNSCKEESKLEEHSIEAVHQQLIGSWATEAFQLESEDTLTQAFPPYIILEEYGSAITLDEEQNYFTFYKENPNEGINRGTWKILNKSSLQFTKINSTNNQANFTVGILKLESNTLWLKEQKVTYRLFKIQ